MELKKSVAPAKRKKLTEQRRADFSLIDWDKVFSYYMGTFELPDEDGEYSFDNFATFLYRYRESMSPLKELESRDPEYSYDELVELQNRDEDSTRDVWRARGFIRDEAEVIEFVESEQYTEDQVLAILGECELVTGEAFANNRMLRNVWWMASNLMRNSTYDGGPLKLVK